MLEVTNVLKPPIIKRSWLLAVYIVLPLTLILVIIDFIFLEQTLQPYLTANALYFPLVILLFELPHIIGSLVTFADTEYLTFYKQHLLSVLPITLIAFSTLFFFSISAGVLAYVFYTMYHSVRQQTGLALTMTKKRDRWHEVWTYSAVIATFLGYLLIFSEAFLSPAYETFIQIILIPLSILFVSISTFMLYRAPRGTARMYVGAASAAIFASYLLLLFNYLFLAAFILRFIHDVTAFIVYITHDRSRNRITFHNVFYKPFAHLGVPIFLATPFVAILIAYVLRIEFTHTTVGAVCIMLLGVMHYSLEAVMWKRDAIHRTQLRFE